MISEEKQNLFSIVRNKLGGGVRVTELKDEVLCDLLKLAIGNYAERVQSFVIESNWANLYGKQLSNIDIAYALSVRTLDIAKDYSYYFSKEVGLQTRGTKWELKKDYVKLEKGRQVYVIPKGREINKVMWVTPPTTDAAMWANYGGLSANFGGVYGQMGGGAAALFGGMGGTYGMGVGAWALPAYDVELMAADLREKNRLFRSDLTYKVTAGPDGTHLLHLMSTPGSPFTFGAGGINMLPLQNCYCWYTYYDTDSSNSKDCMLANPDVLLTPDQVPLNQMEYEMLNPPTQNIVQNLLIAEAAETIAFIRGKFSGNINLLGAGQLTMDYNMYMTYGNNAKQKALEDLDKRLENLSPYKVMENQANLVENMLRAKKGTPLPIIIA